MPCIHTHIYIRIYIFFFKCVGSCERVLQYSAVGSEAPDCTALVCSTSMGAKELCMGVFCCGVWVWVRGIVDLDEDAQVGSGAVDLTPL